MSFAVYPQPDACRAWMPTIPLPPSMSPPSPPLVCHMPRGHDGPHSNERRPSTLSRRWEGDARPAKPHVPASTQPDTRPLAVDADGYVWRINPDGSHSMARINPDNSPTPEPLAVFVPVEQVRDVAQALREKARATEAEGVTSGNRFLRGRAVGEAASAYAIELALLPGSERPEDGDACDRCGSRDPYECADGCDCPDCVDGEDREP